MKSVLGVGLVLAVVLPLALVPSAQQASSEQHSEMSVSEGSSQGPIPGINRQLVEVKFREGSGVRLRDGRLVSTREHDLEELHALLARSDVIRIGRAFTDSEEELEALWRELVDVPGPRLSEFNLFYQFTLGPRAVPESFLEEILAMDVVEDAQFYRQPINALLPTPNLTAEQGYLASAPGGIDADYASGVPGGKGKGISIIDLELGWNLTHEDLGPGSISLIFGANSTVAEDIDHGTAVLGILAGTSNGMGVTGIARDANVAVISWGGGYVAQSILSAVKNLSAGDVMLLEGQITGPQWLGACDGTSQAGCVPIEYATSSRAAIIAAVKKGIVVVEAAGNGGNDLDQSAFKGRFDRTSATYPDSGAILVGAGYAPGTAGANKPARSRVTRSNYGSRLDVQGWGNAVVTTGYGDRFDGGKNRRYTQDFAGTSAAAAIVAGAAASVEGSWKASQGTVLSPNCVRRILVDTGTAQVADPLSMFATTIGPLPDLKAALKLSQSDVATLCGFAPEFHKPDLYWPPLVRVIVPERWIELVVWLSNEGPLPAGPGYMIEIYLDDELVERREGRALEPGERMEIVFSYARAREGQVLRIVADAYHELDEANEENNEFLFILETPSDEAGP